MIKRFDCRPKVALDGNDSPRRAAAGNEGCTNASLGALDMVMVRPLSAFTTIHSLSNKNPAALPSRSAQQTNPQTRKRILHKLRQCKLRKNQHGWCNSSVELCVCESTRGGDGSTRHRHAPACFHRVHQNLRHYVIHTHPCKTPDSLQAIDFQLRAFSLMLAL